MPTRQQVADQLNKLNSQGATEKQILDYVAGAGYVPDDFNADLNGSFSPMVVGTGTSTTNYTAAEARESQQYFENLTASSSTVTPKPSASITTASTTTKTVTTTEVTNFQQTTGGGTSTVISTPSKDTAASLDYKAQANQAFNLQQAYGINPNSTLGQKTLDRKLAEGTITPAQYNEIKNLSPEDRRAKSLEYNAQYDTARTKEIATKEGGQPAVVTTPSQNSSSITVDYQKSTSTSSTTLNGAVGGTNITTETVEGVTYQVVNNADGTKSYTPADAPNLAAAQDTSVTIADNPTPKEIINPNSDPNTNIGTEGQDFVFEPLQEPPITNDGDEFSGIDEQVQRQKDLEDGSLEFAGIDEQIALNENALQEPPVVSDDEIDKQIALAAAQDETITSPSSITENVFDPSGNNGAPQVEESVFDPTGNQGAPQGISTALNNTRSTATKDDSVNFKQKPDWRARLSLAPNSNYLYNVPKGQAGILAPLQGTDGVIFPYTPAISVTYSAGYDPSELIHSNYKVYQYKGSSVDAVSITADFTAQDTPEANYLLAVIHFFRSVTKMFYGQDQNPNNGVPPPLCYLSGFGAYTFDAHPLVVTNFTYSTPTEVDYIRAGSQTNQPGVNVAQQNTVVNSFVPSVVRKAMSGLAPKVPNFSTQNTLINSDATYVPTKIQLQITCIPIVTRNDISNKFSLKEYATGALLRGSKRSGGGIW